MKTLLFICLALLAGAGAAHAQMAVHDNPTFMQAQQTASHTAQIMNSNENILNTVNQTLAAVTGNRSTGSLSSMGLGGGFQMSSVPELGSLLGGGGLSMNGLGSYGALASDIINGLNLVKTLTGGSSAGRRPTKPIRARSTHPRRLRRRWRADRRPPPRAPRPSRARKAKSARPPTSRPRSIKTRRYRRRRG